MALPHEVGEADAFGDFFGKAGDVLGLIDERESDEAGIVALLGDLEGRLIRFFHTSMGNAPARHLLDEHGAARLGERAAHAVRIGHVEALALNAHEIDEAACHLLVAGQQRGEQGARLLRGGNLPGELFRRKFLQARAQLAHGGDDTDACAREAGSQKFVEICGSQGVVRQRAALLHKKGAEEFRLLFKAGLQSTLFGSTGVEHPEICRQHLHTLGRGLHDAQALERRLGQELTALTQGHDRFQRTTGDHDGQPAGNVLQPREVRAQRLAIHVAGDVERIALVFAKLNHARQRRVAALLESLAGLLKRSAVLQGLQQYMAVHVLEPLQVKGQHRHLLRITYQLDVVAVGVLNDLVMSK